MTAPRNESALVSADRVVKEFAARDAGRTALRAVDDVSLDIRRGETLGLVGETGSGKTTLARCIMRLENVTSGNIVFEGANITHASSDELRPIRRRMQMVFQDPYGSLNPRRRVGAIIGDPFAIHGEAEGEERDSRVRELMETVGLDPALHSEYPSAFSGGQRQRIGIARALALKPSLIVCDEPVSALDVSIRAQILNLLADLQKSFGLTYLFISHDLAVVRHFCDRVAVMNKGKLVEVAETDALFSNPQDAYTKTLLDAAQGK